MFYLTLIYLIIYYLQPGSRFPVLGSIRIELVIGTVILFCLLMAKGGKIFQLTKINKSILGFFIALCCSFLGAFLTHTGSHAIEVFIDILKCFSMYIMIVGTVQTEKQMKIFMFVYLGVIMFYVTEAFIMGQYLYKDDVNHLTTIGQFGHYNSLGGITASNFSFIMQFIIVSPIWIKALLGVFSIIGVQVIILTGSRTAYIGFIMLCLQMIMFSKRKILMIFLATISTVFIFSIMPDNYKERFYSIGKTKDVVSGVTVNDSINARWIIIEDAWAVFLKYPITGVGLDSFYQVRGVLFNRWQQTHNLYLQILAEIGIIGFIAFFILMKVIWTYLKLTKEVLTFEGKRKSFFYHLISGLQMFLIMRLTVGLFGHDLYENYWWFIAGLSAASYKIVMEKYRKQINNRMVRYK